MILLSFLGIGNYKECTYIYEDKEFNTPYFVEAVNYFLHPEEIKIFLTDEASEKHSKALHGKVKFKEIRIPSGINEDELWKIANIIIDEVPKKSDIVFDLTYGFRTLPLFGVGLLIYLRIAKNIKINSILYGAFDATYNNKTPVFNLNTVLNLIDWSYAVSEFLNYGYSFRLKDLLCNIQREAHKKNLENKPAKLSASANFIDNFSKSFSLININELEDSIYGFLKNVDEINSEFHKFDNLKPFEILFEIIVNRFNDIHFKSESLEEIIPASQNIIQWYIDTRHYQQAITLMYELLISFHCLKYKKKISERKNRNYISKLLYKFYKSENKSFEIYNQISQLRNEINHAGMRENVQSAKSKIDNIQKYFDILKKHFEEFKEKENYFDINDKGILINLSNHPLKSWTTEQNNSALVIYNEIIDLEFPNISPETNEDKIDKLADEYLKKCEEIFNQYPIGNNAVHIMGELTFCYSLINKLKNENITCIASTTHRKTYFDESGNKISKFEFVQFREY